VPPRTLPRISLLPAAYHAAHAPALRLLLYIATVHIFFCLRAPRTALHGLYTTSRFYSRPCRRRLLTAFASAPPRVWRFSSWHVTGLFSVLPMSYFCGGWTVNAVAAGISCRHVCRRYHRRYSDVGTWMLPSSSWLTVAERTALLSAHSLFWQRHDGLVTFDLVCGRLSTLAFVVSGGCCGVTPWSICSSGNAEYGNAAACHRRLPRRTRRTGDNSMGGMLAGSQQRRKITIFALLARIFPCWRHLLALRGY